MSIGIAAGTALAIGSGVSAAGSIASSAIGAHAAGKAADAQEQAAEKAEQLNQPWVNAGTNSVGQLMQGFQNGTYGPGSIPNFTAPTAEQAEATPGYQFTQSQGMRGVSAAASAAGGSLGGAELKAADQYNSGLANSTYNDTFNRSLSTYQAQLQGQQQSFNQLFNVSNQGEAAANNVGNTMLQAGNAQAAGIVGQANAISGGINSATSDVSQGILLNQILGQGGGALRIGPGGVPTTPYSGSFAPTGEAAPPVVDPGYGPG